MAKSASRDFLVKKGGTTLASITSKSITVDQQPIEVTSDDDAGVQTFLSNVYATKSMQISAEGYTDDDVLSDLAFNGTDTANHITDLTLERPNGDVISGTFILTNYVETGGGSDGSVTFTATFVRNGAHTFTPAV